MEKNNSLLVKEDDGFLKKIKRFFKNLLKRNNIKESNTELEYSNTNEIKNSNEDFSHNLSEQTNIEEIRKKEKIQEIIDIIEKEPKTLDNLTIDKLKIIDNYYDEKIQEADEKIKKLKSKLA